MVVHNIAVNNGLKDEIVAAAESLFMRATLLFGIAILEEETVQILKNKMKNMTKNRNDIKKRAATLSAHLIQKQPSVNALSHHI